MSLPKGGATLTTLNHKRLLPVLLVAGLILAAAIWPTGSGTEAEAAPTARTTYTMTFPAGAIGYPTVSSRYHGVYLLLMQPSGLNYKFYGVTVRYQA